MNFYCTGWYPNKTIYIGLYGENDFAHGVTFTITNISENDIQALALFQTIGTIERLGIKKAYIYHLCEGLYLDNSPQIRSLRKRMERVKRKGLDYQYNNNGKEGAHEKAEYIMKNFTNFHRCPSCREPFTESNRVFKGYPNLRYICNNCNETKYLLVRNGFFLSEIDEELAFLLKESPHIQHLSNHIYNASIKSEQVRYITETIRRRKHPTFACVICKNERNYWEFGFP